VSIPDGTLLGHIGASLLRVGDGSVLALVVAVPLGIAMGVSPVVNVKAKHQELFSDLPAIPADVAIKPGYVFTP